MHKGFKCLDLSTGRIYISRDIIFDENVFPFSKLQPNVSPKLHLESSLLPQFLTNPSSPGGESDTNHMNNVTIATDFHEELQLEQGSPNIGENGPGAATGNDPPTASTSGSPSAAPNGVCEATPGHAQGPVPGAVPGDDAWPTTTPPDAPEPITIESSAGKTGALDVPIGGHDLFGAIGSLSGMAGPVRSSTAADPSAHSSTAIEATPSAHPRTRLQNGIQKTKVYTDGTVWYGCFASVITEPRSISEALSNCHWKNAMDSEYHDLQKNKTWHLVPPQQGRNS
jgi:hypothetical protein